MVKLIDFFYNEECLHQLRSCAKLLVSMAIGIVLENGMLKLDTYVYPAIKNIVNIENKSNLQKIEKWTVRDSLTHTSGYEKQMMSESYIKVISKLREVYPYEEPAIDIIPLLDEDSFE